MSKGNLLSNFQGLDGDDDGGKNNGGAMNPQGDSEKSGGAMNPQGDSGKKSGGAVNPKGDSEMSGERMNLQGDSEKKNGGLTPQVSGRKSNETNPKGDSGKKNGGMTPQVSGEENEAGGPINPNYSPATPPPVTEKKNNSPEYSPCSDDPEGNSGVKQLDFSREGEDGMDFKHSGEKVEKRDESSAEAWEEGQKNKVSTKTSVPQDELIKRDLGKDDRETVRTLEAKSTSKAGFSMRAYNLKEEENCAVCPNKTSSVYALFKKGDLIFAAKCDTAFCMLSTCSNYFFETEEPVVAAWIDRRIKGKIEKAEKSNAQDQIIHQCKEAAETVIAVESMKADLRKCMDLGAGRCGAEFLKILLDAEVVEFQKSASTLSKDNLKDLVNLGITNNLKCACGKADDNVSVTVVSADSLVGQRAHVHCGSLSCLVQSLERNTNMTPSANPKLVEYSGANRDHIDEKKAKELHRLIFFGQELLKLVKDAVAGSDTEKQRALLARNFEAKREEDEAFGTNEQILKSKQAMDSEWLAKKLAPKRLAKEADDMKTEIEEVINELNAGIPEDKGFAEKQVEIRRINAEVAEIEQKIKALAKQAEQKKEEKAQEFRNHEIDGVKNYRKLLEINPFEKIGRVTGLIYRYKKKIAEVVQARKEMEQKRYSVARFYEEVLEIPDEQKLPEHNFGAILHIEPEYDGTIFASLTGVIDRCDMMQKQAKEIEKESWSKCYRQASETRRIHKADLSERVAEVVLKNKALIEKIAELEAYILLEKVAQKNERDEEVGKYAAQVLEKDERIKLLQKENQDAHDSIKELDRKLEEIKKKRGENPQVQEPQEDGWATVARGRGASGREGRGGCRSAASSSSVHRAPPQLLNQTQTFCHSSSSSSSSNSSASHRDQQGGRDFRFRPAFATKPGGKG